MVTSVQLTKPARALRGQPNYSHDDRLQPSPRRVETTATCVLC